MSTEEKPNICADMRMGLENGEVEFTTDFPHFDRARWEGVKVELEKLGFDVTLEACPPPAGSMHRATLRIGPVEEDDSEDKLDHQDFVDKHGIRMVATPVDSNPNMDSEHEMNHYLCNLGIGDRTMEVHFSQGLGIKGKPDAVSVIACLGDDARSVENALSFEDWAGDLGFDEDSRSAERTYTICVDQARRLAVFLGGAAYNELLYEVEER